MGVAATPVGTTHNKSTPVSPQVDPGQAKPWEDPHSAAGTVAAKSGTTHNKSTPLKSAVSPSQRKPWEGPHTDLAPSLQRLTPASGAAAGGTAVVAIGYNFTGVTSVTVGGVATTAFSVVSDREVHFTTGAHAAGAVDVVFTKSAGPDSTFTGAYTYV